MGNKLPLYKTGYPALDMMAPVIDHHIFNVVFENGKHTLDGIIFDLSSNIKDMHDILRFVERSVRPNYSGHTEIERREMEDIVKRFSSRAYMTNMVLGQILGQATERFNNSSSEERERLHCGEELNIRIKQQIEKTIK